MSPRVRALVFAISTPLVAFVVVGGLLGAARAPEMQRAAPPLRVFQNVRDLIAEAYVEPVDMDKVMDGAMRGLTEALDASSAALTPAEVRALNDALPAADVGLVLTRQFYLRVVGVRDNSPAQRAGVMNGDYVRAINDTPTRDMPAITGNRLLHGAPGSKVSLVVLRGSATDPHVFELTREVAPPRLAAGRQLETGEAYVRVTSFSRGTATAIRTELASIGAAAARGVIIDLRDTADGAAEDAIAAAKLFVKSGTIATRAGREAADREVVAAADTDGEFTMPVVLAVSNGTANAAEIFAAALAGNERAKLVGEPTAGIAAVQRLVSLPEGHGLWLTYARYLQADGSPIHQRGLHPDVPVETPMRGFDDPPPASDVVLQRAAEELRKQ